MKLTSIYPNILKSAPTEDGSKRDDDKRSNDGFECGVCRDFVGIELDFFDSIGIIDGELVHGK